ncbi:PTS transporter subunit EIIC [Spiroplasma taiwanense]|uniref:PTS transporter subunit EIIC n=1 Tax=Spiroplasma taiwanense TaxID=2145 RepID=UPI0004255DB6|nr:PTS transporter subunit EIIC [Spiroplasma taiwanense]
MSMFFIAGPILSLIEQTIGLGVGYLSKIPYGIGTGIMALTWQPLVITGMHVPIVMPVAIGVSQGIYTTLMFPLNIATFTQVGVAIAVGIRTKNMKLRQAAFAALPGGFVGVTEPIIYGVNLPKVKPFIIAIISALFLGILAGILGIEARTPGGLGIFGILGTLMEPRLAEEVVSGQTLLPSTINLFTGEANSMLLNAILYGLMLFASIAVSCKIGMLFYTERVKESKQIKRNNELLVKMYALSKKISIEDAKNKIEKNLK